MRRRTVRRSSRSWRSRSNTDTASPPGAGSRRRAAVSRRRIEKPKDNPAVLTSPLGGRVVGDRPRDSQTDGLDTMRLDPFLCQEPTDCLRAELAETKVSQWRARVVRVALQL